MTLGISFAAGQYLTADDLQAMVDQIDSLTDPGWTSYTPVWTSSGTAPAIGNGTITGRYRRAANSDLIIAEIKMVLGTTSTVGTGVYSWSLPVAAKAASVDLSNGSGSWLRSGTIRDPITCTMKTTTTIGAYHGPFANTATTINNRGGDMSATAPIVPGTGDTYVLSIAYDAA